MRHDHRQQPDPPQRELLMQRFRPEVFAALLVNEVTVEFQRAAMRRYLAGELEDKPFELQPLLCTPGRRGMLHVDDQEHEHDFGRPRVAAFDVQTLNDAVAWCSCSESWPPSELVDDCRLHGNDNGFHFLPFLHPDCDAMGRRLTAEQLELERERKRERLGTAVLEGRTRDGSAELVLPGGKRIPVKIHRNTKGEIAGAVLNDGRPLAE